MLAMWILFDGIRSSMMGMTIDDCISELTWVRKVNEEIIKTDAKEIDVNSAWIEHWKNVVKSLDVAIDTMRKYQKIQEIVAKWEEEVHSGVSCSFDRMEDIKEVVEDGNN